jgi:hypothetical protein
VKDLTQALAIAGLIFKQTDVYAVEIDREKEDTLPFKIRVFGQVDLKPLARLVLDQDLTLSIIGGFVTIA